MMIRHLRLWWLGKQLDWGWISFQLYFARRMVLTGEWEQVGPGHYSSKRGDASCTHAEDE